MTRGRLMLLLVGATALAAMALPGSAMAGRAHLIKLYKVEKHIDLQGQDDTYTVSCDGQDLALQGMWRVDDVEQDNDYFNAGPGGSWGTTSPPASNDHADWDVLRSARPTMVQHNGDSSYDFQFTPLSGGDAQLKVWVTCLGKNAESVHGHTVSWALTNATSTGPTTVPNPPAGTTIQVPSTPCPAGFVAVQPGFRIGTAALPGGDADLTRFNASNNDRSWNWTFDNVQGDPGSTNFIYSTSSSCLELRSGFASDASGHRHRIVKKTATSYSQPNILANRVSEVQAHCGELYKGMLGGWDYSLPTGWSNQLYFLGMDPRIKIRAFKFINRGGLVPTASVVSLLCFKDKTT